MFSVYTNFFNPVEGELYTSDVGGTVGGHCEGGSSQEIFTDSGVKQFTCLHKTYCKQLELRVFTVVLINHL